MWYRQRHVTTILHCNWCKFLYSPFKSKKQAKFCELSMLTLKVQSTYLIHQYFLFWNYLHLKYYLQDMRCFFTDKFLKIKNTFSVWFYFNCKGIEKIKAEFGTFKISPIYDSYRSLWKPVFCSRGTRKHLIPIKKHSVFTEKLNRRKINHGLIQSKK